MFFGPRFRRHFRASSPLQTIAAVTLSCIALGPAAARAFAAPAATTTTLTMTVAGVPVTNVQVKTVVTLTATVTANGATPAFPGTVNFCDATAAQCADIHLLGTAQLTSAGMATINLIPGVGAHSYKAVFVGTNSAAGSTSGQANLTVTGTYPSNTVLVATGVPGNYTLTATTSGSGHVSPTGSVSFLDTTNSNYVLGTDTLSSVTTNFSFYVSSTVPTGNNPESAAVGDFNGDGKLDFVTANEDSNTVSVLLGNGDGTFTAAASIPTDKEPIDVVTADFNNDGKVDIAVSNRLDNTVQVFLGNGDGTFQLASSTATGPGPYCIALGDFNGDGNLDIATANLDNTVGQATGTQANGVSILLGNGDGTFTVGASLASGDGPTAILSGDFNGDGKVDLAVANNGDSALSIYLGNGDGTFTAAPNAVTSKNPFWLVEADFNGDGKQDIAVADTSTGSLTILLGNGDGTFTASPSRPQTLGAPNFAMAVGDLNGDGKADLAVTNSYNASLSVFLGNGDGTFTATTSPPTGDEPDFVIAADFDGDGNADLGVQNILDNSTTVLLSQAAATAQVTGISPVGTGTHYAVAQYSGDNRFTSGLSNTVPLTAERVTTTLTLTANPTTSVYSQQVVLTASVSPNTAQDHNASGLVTFYNGTTSIGTGTVSGGIATLNITSLPVGNNSLSAAYPGDTNFTPSTSAGLPFTVAPNSATIVFNVPDHTYGDPPFTVLATSNSTGAITYSVVSGPATISGNTVTITGAGVVTLQASQTAAGVYSATTQNATFNVAKASQTITFAAPASPLSLGAPPITLSASATSGLAVTFRIVSGPAVVSGNTLTIIGAGTIVVAADQPGNANYAAAPEVTHTVVVNPLTPTIALTATPNPVFVQNPVTLSAVITTAVVAPTGTVTFLDGTTPVGTAAVSGGTATLTTSSLAVGTHKITASYSGDSNFLPAATLAITEQVQDFGFAINYGELTIPHGGQAVYNLTITSIGGPVTPAAINLAITGAPDHAQITFTPASIAAGSGTTTVALTIQTPDYPDGPWNPPVAASLGIGGLVALACLLFPFTRRRRSARTRLQRLGCVLLLAGASFALAALSGCGSGWGPQAYYLTVSGTSGQLSHTATSTLKSQ